MWKRFTTALIFVTVLSALCFTAAASAEAVAQIGGKEYPSLSAALAEVEDGQVIALQKGITAAAPIDLSKEGVTYTLDLNGQTISGAEISQTLEVSAGAVTIQNGAVTSDKGYTIYNDGATLTLRDLTVTNTDASGIAVYSMSGSTVINASEYHGGDDALYVRGGSVVILSGTFSSSDGAGDGCIVDHTASSISLAAGSSAQPMQDEWYGKTRVVVTALPEESNANCSDLRYSVAGGPAIPIAGFDPEKTEYSVSVARNTVEDITIALLPTTAAPSAVITENRAATIQSGAGEASVTVTSSDGTNQKTYTVSFTSVPALFESGGVFFQSLQDALGAVADGGTIAMLKNVSLDAMFELEVPKSYTLDLGGFCLSNSADVNLDAILYVSKGTVVIKNGQIANTTGAGMYCDGGNVTLNAVSVRASGSTSFTYALGVGSGTVMIRSSDLLGPKQAIFAFGGAATIESGNFSIDPDIPSGPYVSALVEDGGTIGIATGSDAMPAKEDWPGARAVEVTHPDQLNADLASLAYKLGEEGLCPIDGFDPAQLEYAVTLPIGTQDGTVIKLEPTTASANATTTLADATLADGCGTASVEVQPEIGQATKTYTVRFTVTPARFETGGTYYATLAEAVDEVAAGALITMLADVALDETVNLSKNARYTLDLGGHCLSNAGNAAALISITAGDVGILNGSIVNTFATAIEIAGGNATLSLFTVRAEGQLSQAPRALSLSSGTVNILSGDYYGTGSAICASGGRAILTLGSFACAQTGDGSLVEGGGAIDLAAGRAATPSKAQWPGATLVTVNLADASVTPAAARFDKYPSSSDYLDITVALDIGGYTQGGIQLDASDLTEGSQYEANAATGAFTFRREWLKTLANGDHTLTFLMSGGSDPELTLTVADSTPDPAPDPDPVPAFGPVVDPSAVFTPTDGRAAIQVPFTGAVDGLNVTLIVGDNLLRANATLRGGAVRFELGQDQLDSLPSGRHALHIESEGDAFNPPLAKTFIGTLVKKYRPMVEGSVDVRVPLGGTGIQAFTVKITGSDPLIETPFTIRVGNAEHTASRKGDGLLDFYLAVDTAQAGVFGVSVFAPETPTAFAVPETKVGTLSVADASGMRDADLANKLGTGWIVMGGASDLPVGFKGEGVAAGGDGAVEAPNNAGFDAGIHYAKGKWTGQLSKSRVNPFALAKGVHPVPGKLILSAEGKADKGKGVTLFHFSAQEMNRLEPGTYLLSVKAKSGPFKGLGEMHLAVLRIAEGAAQPGEWTMPETLRMSVGQAYHLVNPAEAGGQLGGFAFKSGNKGVAAVDEVGVVRGKKAGKATITATAPDGTVRKSKLTVVANRFTRGKPLIRKEEGVFTSTKRLEYNKKGQLIAEVYVYNRTDKPIHGANEWVFELYEDETLRLSEPVGKLSFKKQLKKNTARVQQWVVTDDMLQGVKDKAFDIGSGRYQAVIRGTDLCGNEAKPLNARDKGVSAVKTAKGAEDLGAPEAAPATETLP